MRGHHLFLTQQHVYQFCIGKQAKPNEELQYCDIYKKCQERENGICVFFYRVVNLFIRPFSTHFGNDKIILMTIFSFVTYFFICVCVITSFVGDSEAKEEGTAAFFHS